MDQKDQEFKINIVSVPREIKWDIGSMGAGSSSC